MTKKTIIITLVIALSLTTNAYFFGAQAWKSQKNKWINSGALQMREAVFQSVEKGETQLSNAKGDKTIIIIKK